MLVYLEKRMSKIKHYSREGGADVRGQMCEFRLQGHRLLSLLILLWFYVK